MVNDFESDRDRKLPRLIVDERLAPPIQIGFEYIDNINFEMIIEKITTPDENIAKLWSRDAAIEAVRYYKNYLKILRKYGAEYDFLPPSIEIDEIWHHHILDTEKYQHNCNKIFGKFLHHYPYFGMRFVGDKINLDRAFEITQKLHIAEFGEPILGFDIA